MTTQPPNTRTAYRTCPLCEATCGLAIDVEGERVVRVRGDADDVLSRGFICPKGATIGELHHDPDRLRQPMVRKDGELVAASWPEAWEAVERGLLPVIEEHGNNAVAAYLGNPNVHNLAGALFVRPLLKSLGTRNVFSASTVDQMPKHVSSGLLFGDPLGIPVPDIDRCDYLLMLGANPLESNGSLWTVPDAPGRLRALRKRGGKLIVIDPRRTRTAELADEHLPIRPGTDSALLVGLAHVLFEEGLVSLGPLADCISELEALRERARAFTPEKVGSLCGIEPDTIVRLARELASASSAAVYARIGTHTTVFGTLAAWATDVVNILTGNLDRPGGAMFPLAAHQREQSRPGGRGFVTGRWKSRVRGLPEVRGELPVAVLAEEIDTPGEEQVRALLTVGGNPALSTPAADRLDAALASLDFMVSIDIYCNETTRHADVILPPPSPLERSHYDLAFSTLAVRNVANFSEAVFSHQGPSEAEILAKLTLILGGQGTEADPGQLGRLLVGGSLQAATRSEGSPLHGRDPAELAAALGDRPMEDQLLDTLLRSSDYGDLFGAKPDGVSIDRMEQHPHGIDLGSLQPRLPNMLKTVTGTIEIFPELIAQDMARLEAELERSAARPAGELLLIGRRHLRSNNSWMHNLPGLAGGKPRCTLQMHPSDAEARKLADGSMVRVRSSAGELEVVLECWDGLMQGVVSLPHGWGHDAPGAQLSVAARAPGVNSNRLTDSAQVDPLSGNAALNAIPVEVTPASD